MEEREQIDPRMRRGFASPAVSLRVLSIISVCILFLTCVHFTGAPQRTHEVWTDNRFRDIAVAAYHQGLHPDGLYWGPITPEMLDRVGLRPGSAIDSRNEEGPGDFMRGPFMCGDRGRWTRIKGYPFWLFSNGAGVEIVVARAMDGDVDLRELDLESAADNMPWKGRLPILLVNKIYDPTNGSYSNGDWFRVVRGNEKREE